MTHRTPRTIVTARRGYLRQFVLPPQCGSLPPRAMRSDVSDLQRASAAIVDDIAEFHRPRVPNGIEAMAQSARAEHRHCRSTEAIITLVVAVGCRRRSKPSELKREDPPAGRAIDGMEMDISRADIRRRSAATLRPLLRSGWHVGCSVKVCLVFLRPMARRSPIIFTRAAALQHPARY